MGYRLTQSKAAAPAPVNATGAAVGITTAEADARDRANRDRDNHRGRQAVETVEGLSEALGSLSHKGVVLDNQIAALNNVKADKSLLHEPVSLHPDSGSGLSIDGQVLHYTPPAAVAPVPCYGVAVPSFDAITEPRFGVIYSVDGVGSYILSQDGKDWVMIASLLPTGS